MNGLGTRLQCHRSSYYYSWWKPISCSSLNNEGGVLKPVRNSWATRASDVIVLALIRGCGYSPMNLGLWLIHHNQSQEWVSDIVLLHTPYLQDSHRFEHDIRDLHCRKWSSALVLAVGVLPVMKNIESWRRWSLGKQNINSHETY